MHYRSNTQLLGLPLIHVAVGPAAGSAGVRGIAKGWIAIGDIAFGIVFALGGLAVGGLSVGGLSVGVLALAGVSIGIWSVGGLALGVFALGGGAIAVVAANGGLAVAREYAAGGAATAAHANTDAARLYFESSPFFRAAAMAAQHSRWLLVLVVIAPLAHAVTRRRGGSA
jgi:hypothetical protein